MKFKVLLIVLFFAYINTQTDAENAYNDRKTKVRGCMNLLKSVVHHDEDYVPALARSILDATKDMNEWTRRIARKGLLNCYTSVSLIKAAELIGKKKYENLNPFIEENKKILNLYNYEKRYETNKVKLEKDMDLLEDILVDIQAETSQLEGLVRKRLDELNEKLKKESNYEQFRQQSQQSDEPQERPHRYEGSNLNLKFFDEIDPKIRYAIGFGLILLVLGVLYLTLRSLTVNKEKSKKKKNK